MEFLIQDLKYSLRMYAKNSGVTLIAILTIALGIGASTAVFSVVNAILFKELPYRHAEQIVIPWRIPPAGINLGYNEIPWGNKDFRRMLRDTTVFQYLGAFKSDAFNLTGANEPTLVEGLRASADFFPALGVSPTIGRTFNKDEDQQGHEYEVILSYSLWQERFNGSSEVLGRAINLNGFPYTVIGAMPPGFVFPQAAEMPGSFPFPRRAQLWVPLAVPVSSPPNEPSELAVIGRLKPGTSLDQAQTEMNALATRWEQENPRYKGWANSRVTPLSRQVAGETRRPMLLLLIAVGIIMLIACSNIANLLLARSLERKTEFRLRLALGAGPQRLVRQVLTESILLSIIGGVIGIFLALAAIYGVKNFGPANIPRLSETGLDWRVLLFIFTTTLLSGILFGLAPVAGFMKKNLVDSLKEIGGRTYGSATGAKLRNALLVAEVALALVLVVAAGLVTRTFFHMLRADAGFNATHVLTFEFSLTPAKYSDNEHITAFYKEALERLRPLPGVEAAGIGETLPMGGNGESSVVRIPSRVVKDDKERPYANYTIVTPGYFSAVGTLLFQGRDFVDADTADSSPVVIINAAMAKKYWPGRAPLGQQMGLGSPRFPLMTIVGIVGNVKHLSMREDPGPEMYVPYTQKPYPSMLTMQGVVRSKGDPYSVLAGIRTAVRTLDPDLPVAKVASLEEIVSDSMVRPRFSMFLLALFGMISLVLGSIGVYGVMSYTVSQRTQEIGIRMALGAQRTTILRMVLWQGIRLAALGVIIGLVGAIGITRTMASFLYGVQALDPLTFITASLLLVGVTALAGYLPARRATRIDPLNAIRYE